MVNTTSSNSIMADTATTIDIVILSTEAAFGLLANSFVIAAVVCNRKMRQSAMNLLIANLATADFLLLLYTLTIYSSDYLMQSYLPGLLAFDKYCILASYIPDTCWEATIATFVAIAVERWFLPILLLSSFSCLLQVHRHSASIKGALCQPKAHRRDNRCDMAILTGAYVAGPASLSKGYVFYALRQWQ